MEKTYQSPVSAELLKRQIERLQSEQQKEMDNAIYLGITPETAERLETRRALIKALMGELYDTESVPKSPELRADSECNEISYASPSDAIHPWSLM